MIFYIYFDTMLALQLWSLSADFINVDVDHQFERGSAIKVSMLQPSEEIVPGIGASLIMSFGLPFKIR